MGGRWVVMYLSNPFFAWPVPAKFEFKNICSIGSNGSRYTHSSVNSKKIPQNLTIFSFFSIKWLDLRKLWANFENFTFVISTVSCNSALEWFSSQHYNGFRTADFESFAKFSVFYLKEISYSFCLFSIKAKTRIKTTKRWYGRISLRFIFLFLHDSSWYSCLLNRM